MKSSADRKREAADRVEGPDEGGPPPRAFLLIRAKSDARKLARRLASMPWIEWAAAAYGPHPVVAYAGADNPRKLARQVEQLRSAAGVAELDARICKPVPGEGHTAALATSKSEVAVLLIGVDYRVRKEREVVRSLREIPQVLLSRAMWGPADIIAVIEESDRESMRNLICDRIKTLPGVASNTTLYCYPDA